MNVCSDIISQADVATRIGIPRTAEVVEEISKRHAARGIATQEM
jgi:hypothetical protein